MKMFINRRTENMKDLYSVPRKEDETCRLWTLTLT